MNENIEKHLSPWRESWSLPWGALYLGTCPNGETRPFYSFRRDFFRSLDLDVWPSDRGHLCLRDKSLVELEGPLFRAFFFWILFSGTLSRASRRPPQAVAMIDAETLFFKKMTYDFLFFSRHPFSLLPIYFQGRDTAFS